MFVTGSDVRVYGSAMFSVHMAEHMALNIFIPVFLVLGAPLTLALRALPAAGPDHPLGPREWLVMLVHSSVTRFISHPVTAFAVRRIPARSLLHTTIRRTGPASLGHEFVSAHVLITGYLFFWGIIGVDPGLRWLSFIGRLGLLFAVTPFHAFFGIVTMTMTSAISGTFYR
jgi:putative copper resistance protein D